jgi:hypothetical protein
MTMKCAARRKPLARSRIARCILVFAKLTDRRGMKSHVVVIGAGIAGAASAIELLRPRV